MGGLQEKKKYLEKYLQSLGSVAIAFSSGVDSTFLLKVAQDVLGEKVIAITARSRLFPQRESEEAAAFCAAERIEHVFVDSEELMLESFRRNPENRCYICKRALFAKIQEFAACRGISYVAEGSNKDDEGDYRPGLAAVAELQIKSPLRKAGLTKEEIRRLSKEMHLPTWDKPSFACLASRFVYGEEITEKKLDMVDKAEQKLLNLGFRQVRVRVHGKLARIEVLQKEFPKLFKIDIIQQIEKYFREISFLYVTLDLGGYQTGSMNRTITAAKKPK